MAKFTFFLLALILLSSNSVCSELNKDGIGLADKSPTLLPIPSPSSIPEQLANIPLSDIPLSDIIKDLHSGLSQPSESDLAGAESNPKRKIVGVKKNKNYEIVLYEYSDEESVNPLQDDFDDDNAAQKPSKNTRPTKEGRHKGSSNKKPSTEPEDSNKTDKGSPTTSKPGKKPESSTTRPTPTPPSNPSRKPKQKPSKTRPKPTQLPEIDDPFDIDQTPSLPRRSRPPLPDDEDEFSEQSFDEFDNDDPFRIPGRSTPFPFFREEPRRRRPSSSRKPTRKPSRRGPGPVDDYYDDDDDDDPFPNTRNPSRPTNKPSSRRIPILKKNGTSSNDDFEIPGNARGAGRFKPTRRPTVFDPRPQRRNNKTRPPIEELDDDEYEYDEDPEAGPLCNDPTGKRGICQEYFKCSVLYSNIAGRIDLEDYKCQLPSQIGICCPIVEEKDTQGQRGRALMQMVKGRKALSRQIRKLIRSNVNNSIDFGSDSVIQLDEIEQGLLTRSVQVSRNSAAAGHNKFFPTSKKIRQVSDIGFELLQTTNDLSDRFQLTNEVGGLGLKSFKSSNIAALNDRCPSLAPCGINKYRKIDGSCNNLRKPKMGQSLTPLSRVLEPAYADGRWAPRISVRGFSLPSPRLLSDTFIKDRDNPDNRYTLMVMQFGQFIDHDISSVPIFTFANNSGISCCRNGQFLPPELRHPNCMPIEIPSDDSFYSRFNQRCMNFVRSRIAPRIDCSLGYADQMNAVTHWIDLSNVYGSNEKEERELRLFQGGLLRFSQLADRKPLLPLKRPTPAEPDLDYKAGDDRVNEMQGLMVMHLIWFREHNRIATELFRINPFWNDEQLYQEARRILIAQYQHIIYNEWLPIIIGREYMDSYGILPLTKKGFFRGYDPEIDAAIENSFSVAGFRMGHTLVQGIVRLINELGQDNEAATISNHALNAENTRAPNQIDKWIRGLAQMSIQTFDPFITRHLNGRLFQPKGGMFGMDLSSLNIQRSRDHGVPGYNAFRELCQTGKKAKRFEDFRDWIAPEIIENMRRVYAHPDDVDLWIGGISETPLLGALIGPTFTCIVGDQFARSKKGDRYFYDLGDQTHSFSPNQLKEIRKASFARILCDNGDNLEAVQPSAFLQPDFDFNSLVDCRRSSRIPRINLRLWENEPTP